MIPIRNRLYNVCHEVGTGMTQSVACENCGTQLKSGSSFCGSCGASVRQSQDAGNQDADVTRTSNLLAQEGQQSGGVRITTVRRIGVMSAGKVSLVGYALVAGFFGTLGAIVTAFTSGPLEALGVLIAVPLIYAIIGFLGGILAAWIYNVVAGWVGGIEIELD